MATTISHIQTVALEIVDDFVEVELHLEDGRQFNGSGPAFLADDIYDAESFWISTYNGWSYFWCSVDDFEDEVVPENRRCGFRCWDSNDNAE